MHTNTHAQILLHLQCVYMGGKYTLEEGGGCIVSQKLTELLKTQIHTHKHTHIQTHTHTHTHTDRHTDTLTPTMCIYWREIYTGR